MFSAQDHKDEVSLWLSEEVLSGHINEVIFLMLNFDYISLPFQLFWRQNTSLSRL